MTLLVGNRVYCDDDGQFWLDMNMRQQLQEAAAGDYWTYGGLWYCKLPNGIRCGLSKHHTITEHNDSTITVSPSILMECDGAPEWNWHGWLERGVWRVA